MKIHLLRVLFTACVTAFLIGGCTRTRPGETIVATGTDSALWSRDGQALYYHKYDGTITRYDINTRHEEVLPISDTGVYDISPDGKQMLHKQRVGDLDITDLETRTTKNAYSGSVTIDAAFWVSKDQVALTHNEPGKAAIRTDIFDLRRKSTIPLEIGSRVIFRSSDNTSFIYEGEEPNYYLYSIKPPRHKALGIGESKTRELYLHYLDERKVVYTVFEMGSDPYTVMMDISTRRTRRLPSWDMPLESMISPDMQRYWYTGPHHQDWEPVKLYVVDIPPEVVRQLKAPVK